MVSCLEQALSTGACVFVDVLHVPTGKPLVDGEHVVFFDNMNKTDLICSPNWTIIEDTSKKLFALA